MGCCSFAVEFEFHDSVQLFLFIFLQSWYTSCFLTNTYNLFAGVIAEYLHIPSGIMSQDTEILEQKVDDLTLKVNRLSAQVDHYHGNVSISVCHSVQRFL